MSWRRTSLRKSLRLMTTKSSGLYIGQVTFDITLGDSICTAGVLRWMQVISYCCLKCMPTVENSNQLNLSDAQLQENIDRTEEENVCNQLVHNSRPSNSQWSSPIVLLYKKDGTHHYFCVDDKSLNGVTEADTFPLLRIHSYSTIFLIPSIIGKSFQPKRAFIPSVAYLSF